MKFLSAVLLLFLTLPIWGKEKLSCSRRELKSQDCSLNQGTYQIRLLPQTIAWSDGTWHTINPMPLKGEALEWEKVTFTKIQNWPNLQFWLWGKGVGEAQIQSLSWFVVDASSRKLRILGEGVVRKRRPEEPLNVPKTPAAPKFLYDAWEAYSLRPLKNGELEWQLGSLHKTIHRP